MASAPRLKEKIAGQTAKPFKDKFAGLTLRDAEDGRKEYVNDHQIVIYREIKAGEGKFRKTTSGLNNQALEKIQFDQIIYKGIPTLVPRGTAKFLKDYEPKCEPYSEPMGDYICSRIAEGETLRAICSEEGMPKALTVAKWARENPDFKRLYEESKQIRATQFHDKALEVAENTQNWKEVSVSDLKIKTLKWAAQIGNPAEYDPKPQEAQLAPVKIIINTGIDDSDVIISSTATKEQANSIPPPNPQEEAS